SGGRTVRSPAGLRVASLKDTPREPAIRPATALVRSGPVCDLELAPAAERGPDNGFGVPPGRPQTAPTAKIVHQTDRPRIAAGLALHSLTRRETASDMTGWWSNRTDSSSVIKHLEVAAASVPGPDLAVAVSPVLGRLAPTHSTRIAQQPDL